jgi:hypothetical protein
MKFVERVAYVGQELTVQGNLHGRAAAAAAAAAHTSLLQHMVINCPRYFNTCMLVIVTSSAASVIGHCPAQPGIGLSVLCLRCCSSGALLLIFG